MRVQLFEKIREGSRYQDIYGKIWEARYSSFAYEVQLWNESTGFGLWLNGESITKRLTP